MARSSPAGVWLAALLMVMNGEDMKVTSVLCRNDNGTVKYR